jgi:hypothetical protein
MPGPTSSTCSGSKIPNRTAFRFATMVMVQRVIPLAADSLRNAVGESPCSVRPVTPSSAHSARASVRQQPTASVCFGHNQPTNEAVQNGQPPSGTGGVVAHEPWHVSRVSCSEAALALSGTGSGAGIVVGTSLGKVGDPSFGVGGSSSSSKLAMLCASPARRSCPVWPKASRGRGARAWCSRPPPSVLPPPPPPPPPPTSKNWRRWWRWWWGLRLSSSLS